MNTTIAPYELNRMSQALPGQLLLLKTSVKSHGVAVEAVARWVLRKPLYLIAAGSWLPAHDDLRYSVFRYTHLVNETLDKLLIARAHTGSKLLDMLRDAGSQNRAVLILDFLHHFCDEDVELYVRNQVLEECCLYAKQLSISQPVIILVSDLATDDFRRFFPLLATIADELVEFDEAVGAPATPRQGILF